MPQLQAKSALILIDVQYDFMEGGPLEVPKASEILPVLNNLRKSGLFDLIVTTQDWHPPGHMSFASNHRGRKPFEIIQVDYGKQTLWPDHCVMNTPGADFHKGLVQSPDDIIVRKGTNPLVDSYSAFLDNNHLEKTDLDDVLKQHQIQDIYICGLAMDYCVLYSCLDGVDLGYNTYCIEDASRGIAPDTIESAKIQLEKAGVKIVQSDHLTSATQQQQMQQKQSHTTATNVDNT